MQCPLCGPVRKLCWVAYKPPDFTAALVGEPEKKSLAAGGRRHLELLQETGRRYDDVRFRAIPEARTSMREL